MQLTGTTYGEHFDQALAAQTKEEAEQIFELLVAYQMGALVANGDHGGNVREKAIQNAMTNLGYMAGYHGVDVQEEIEQLYGAAHPIFGPVGTPHSDKEIFEMGVKAGEQLKAAAKSAPADDAGNV